jgi:chemotaxis protein methyltransferase CheR
VSATGPPPGAFSDPGYADVAAALARHAGLKVPPHRYPELEAAARRAMARAHLDDPAAYARHLADGHLPLADLVGAFTVGETYFFRDPPQLDLVRTRVVPEVLARRPEGHVFRAWSAGCASGEEAYTLAILLDGLRLGDRWHVLGTDISRPAIARARAGVYRTWSLRGPARDVALRALEPGERADTYTVPERLRARVRIDYLNLAEDVYPSLLNATSGLDLVLCRNVFIYFERDVVAAVARRLHAALADGGWLLTGLADPPLGAFAPFQSVSTKAGVVYMKPGRGEAAGVRWGAGIAALSSPALPLTSIPTRAPPPTPTRTPPPTPTPPPTRAPTPPPTRAPTRAPTASPPPTPDPVARAHALSRSGDWASVLDLADALLETAAGAATLVRAAANAGDLGRADALSARAVERHPLAAELHLLRGAALAEVERIDDALTAIRRALYLDRGLEIAHATLAGLLARRRDVDGAQRAWRTVRRLCAARAADEVLPLADGVCAGRLSEIASAQLSILGGEPER